MFQKTVIFHILSTKTPDISMQVSEEVNTSILGPVPKTHVMRIHVDDPRRCTG